MPDPMPKWLTKTAVAHRGLHDIAKGIPENSRLAFSKAIEGGYAIELDVRLTGDEQVVVFHDADLRRLCGAEGFVRETPLAELRKLKILGTEETVPSLRDVLDLVQGRVPLLVEIKKDKAEPAGKLEEQVAKMLNHYPGPVAVQSFSPRCVNWFRQHAPHFIRGQIACHISDMGKNLNWYQRLALNWMLQRFHGDPMFLAYDVNDLPSPLTARYRARALPVLSWTVRSPEQRARAAAHADNIIFEELSAS